MREIAILIIVAAVLVLLTLSAHAQSAPMPAKVSLIVCKTVESGKPVDPNAKWTGLETREWAIENSMMQCRRTEVALFDQAEAIGAAAQPFNQQRCQRASLMLGIQWDMTHKSSAYRFWRVACPVPIVNTITGEIIAWKMPDCGRRDVIHCEDESEA